MIGKRILPLPQITGTSPENILHTRSNLEGMVSYLGLLLGKKRLGIEGSSTCTVITELKSRGFRGSFYYERRMVCLRLNMNRAIEKFLQPQ